MGAHKFINHPTNFLSSAYLYKTAVSKVRLALHQLLMSCKKLVPPTMAITFLINCGLSRHGITNATRMITNC